MRSRLNCEFFCEFDKVTQHKLAGSKLYSHKNVMLNEKIEPIGDGPLDITSVVLVRTCFVIDRTEHGVRLRRGMLMFITRTSCQNIDCGYSADKYQT